MSDELPPEPDRLDDFPHPRETVRLLGHDDAEHEFLTAFNSGRLHHAWLVSGPKGIGKATLAWRMARFLICQPVDDSGGLFGDEAVVPTSLDIPDDHPVTRRMLALSEPRLFLLRRPVDARTGKLKQDITVDASRALKGFFAMSAADGGRRVVIIDAADEMNPSAANAVLKVLEEPPKNTFLLLVCHQPARLLPTIRSRCRVLRLAELSPADLGDAMAAAVGEPSEIEDMASIAALAGGSVGRALQMRAAGGFETYGQVLAVFASLPRFERSLAIRLAGSVSGRDAGQRLELVVSLTELLLYRLARTGATGVTPDEAVPGESETLRRLSPDPAAARRWAGIAEGLGAEVRRGAAVNLDPGTLILDMFHRIQIAATESVAA